MSRNAQKTPFQQTLNQFALKKISDAVQQLGKALPCTVASVTPPALVTVTFELNTTVATVALTLPKVTVPVAMWKYARMPVRVGDKGIVVPADTAIAGISGQATGTADLVPRANLSSLVFVPVSNTAWPTVDANAVVLSAPNGVVVQDDTGVGSIVLTPTAMTLKIGGVQIVVNASGIELTGPLLTFNGPVIFNNTATGATGTIDFGASNLTTTGTVTGGTDVVGGGKAMTTHRHSGVTTGGGDTGPAV